MCGIAGFQGDFDAALLDRMNTAIRHRVNCVEIKIDQDLLDLLRVGK